MITKKKIAIFLGILCMLALDAVYIYMRHEAIYNEHVIGTKIDPESEEIENNLFDNKDEIDGLDKLTLSIKTCDVAVSQQAIKDFPRFETFGVPLDIIAGKMECFRVVILPDRDINIKSYICSQFSRKSDYNVLYQKVSYIGKNDIYSEYRFKTVYQMDSNKDHVWAEAYRIIIPKNVRMIRDGYFSYTGDGDESDIMAACDLITSDPYMPVIYRELTKTDQGYEYNGVYLLEETSEYYLRSSKECQIAVDIEQNRISMVPADPSTYYSYR